MKQNDTCPAILSPSQIVVKRSVTQKQQEGFEMQERTWCKLCDGSVLLHPFVRVTQPPSPAFHEVSNDHRWRPVMAAASLSMFRHGCRVWWEVKFWEVTYQQRACRKERYRTVRLLSCSAQALLLPFDPFLSL